MSTVQTSAVVCPTLIGRAEQVALLTELMTQAGVGQRRIALIAGEAGVGKSRLVAELKAIAMQRGVGIVQGRCFEQDRSFPYAPVLDLLRACCVGCSAVELGHLFGATAAELVKLLPELATLLPNLTPTAASHPEQEKRRLFQALTQFLQQLTTTSKSRPGQPLLVVFEDLHWADDASLEWLLYLARQLGTQPILVVLTYRQDESQLSLNQLLAALDRMPFASEFVLAPLTRSEVDAMLRAIFNLTQSPRSEFLDTLYALTEGNPFFIEEVLKSLISAGDIYQVSGEWTRKPLRELQIPRTVQVAVQQRTRQLSEAAQRLLMLAAVAGRRFDFVVLQAITQQTESELLQQVKELIAAQLVVEESDETFAFRHALTRQAIYMTLLGRERKALHRTLAEAMERCYADAPDLYASEFAHHFFEAGLWAPALVWTQRAGEQAERLYAYSEALRHYTRARHCAQMSGQLDQMAVIEQAIGQVYQARGEFPQAIESYESALQATTDLARQAMLKAQIGMNYVFLADERALAYLHDALSELNPVTQVKEIVTATFCLGRHYDFLGQYTQAVAYLEHARQLSEPLDDVVTLHFIYSFLSVSLLWLARFEESIDWARRCIALGETKQNWRVLAYGYLELAESLLRLGRWADLEEFASRSRHFAQRAGWLNLEVWSTLQCAEGAYHQGHLSKAAQLAHDCIVLGTEIQGRRVLVWVNRQLSMVETALGAEEAAYEVGSAAVRQSDELTEVMVRGWSRLALADLYMQCEEWTQATELCEQCAELLAATENRIIQMELGARMAEAYAVQGRLAEATRLVADTLALTQATGARPYEALAWRVQGQVCAAQGRYDEALAAFDRAIAICTELGSQLELAHALYQRGALHRARHDLVSAQADWASARSLCEQMGAQALLWRTHAALGQLALTQQQLAAAAREFAAARAIVAALAAGMRNESFRQHLWRRAAALIPAERPARRAMKAAFGGLTARERAVAALIAQGKSNREIAAALVVSERTVTTHISNIFAKLGYTSRAQIATWAGETGLTRQ